MTVFSRSPSAAPHPLPSPNPAERSRWQLWAEVQHGRVSVAAFDAILAEELAFLRASKDTQARRIQVRWQGPAARFYPIAGHLLRQLVVSPEPPEFVTELALPFTFAATGSLGTSR